MKNAVIDQTNRALWEVHNVIDCIPEELWSREYCEMPLYKHVYHMLHSLDLWFINPYDTSYREPSFHSENLNNLDIPTTQNISREQLMNYFNLIQKKITAYTNTLDEESLNGKPQNCPYSRIELILAQFRHLHTHMGMLMGFIIEATGQWPTVLGLTKPIPADNNYSKFC